MKQHYFTALLCAVFLFSGACSRDIGLMQHFSSPSEDTLVSRGKYLFDVAACGSCHGNGRPGSTLSGGAAKALEYQPVQAPMLSAHPASLAGWQSTDFFRLFRHGLKDEDASVRAGVHEGYEWLSDKDLQALIVYLKRLPAVQGVKPKTKEASLLSFGNAAFTRSVEGYVPEFYQGRNEAYGKYLADSVMRCTECHQGVESLFSKERYLSGGFLFSHGDNEVLVPGLNTKEKDGFIHWTEQDMKIYLQTAITAEGKTVNTDLCPVPFFARASAEDIDALILFFRSLTDT